MIRNAGFLSVFLLLLGGAVGTADAAIDLLPDVTTRTNDLFDNDIVTSIVPGRTHLRLSNATPNLGTGKLYLYGVLPGNPDGTQDIRQRIWRDDGSFYDRDAGRFIFHEEHNHIHVEGWAAYRIREILPGDGVGAIVAEGEKTSFCLVDLQVENGSLPGFNPGGEFFSCSGNVQGLSVGWADIYGKGTQGQEIDITDVPDGEYWLESEADPDDNILELDETNNAARVKVTIGQPQPLVPDSYEPNDSMAELDSRPVGGHNSPVLGPCGPVKTVSTLNVHTGGNDDYYRFYMPATGGPSDQVRVDFAHLQGDLDMVLFNAAGSPIGQSGSTADFETITLNGRPAGWYTVRVFGYSGATNPDYDLTIDPSSNGTPQISVLTPPVGDVQVQQGVETYNITWNATDPESNPTWVTVFANASPVLDGNEVMLHTSLNTDGSLGLHVFNTAELTVGTYWIYCQVTDGGTVTGTWSDGTITLYDPVTALPDVSVIGVTRLLPPVPNPFNPSTLLRFELAQPGHVSWRIYDLRGGLVRVLVEQPLEAGIHRQLWDGRDATGGTVASGVYFGVVDTGAFRGATKLMMLK